MGFFLKGEPDALAAVEAPFGLQLFDAPTRGTDSLAGFGLGKGLGFDLSFHWMS